MRKNNWFLGTEEKIGSGGNDRVWEVLTNSKHRTIRLSDCIELVRTSLDYYTKLEMNLR